MVIRVVNMLFDALTFDNVAAIAEGLMQRFIDGEYDKIDLIYNRFKNAATQIVTTEQFLPIVPIEGESSLCTRLQITQES